MISHNLARKNRFFIQSFPSFLFSGQSSASNASSVGQCVDELAELGWTFAAKEGFRIFNQKTLSEGGQSSSMIAGISNIDGISVDSNSNSDSDLGDYDVDCD